MPTDDRRRQRPTGADAPDSPLSFTIPTSLREYMDRYMDRSEQTTPLVSVPANENSTASGESPTPTLRQQQWVDTMSTNDHDTPESRSPHPAAVAIGTATTTLGDGSGASTTATPLAGPSGTTTQVQSGYLAAWRGMAGHSPHLGAIDPACEDEERHQPLPGSGDGGRPQTRWSSRPRWVTDMRSSSGGVGEGGGAWVGGVGDGSFWAGQGQSPPLSPMVRNTANQTTTNSNIGSAGLLFESSTSSSSAVDHWRELRRAQVEASLHANRHVSPFGHGSEERGRGRGRTLPAPRRDDPVDVPHDASATVEEDSRGRAVHGGIRNGTSWAERGQQHPHQHQQRQQQQRRQQQQQQQQQQHRGRRSLSDFLREIEEMVRAQRAESADPRPHDARPQSAPQSNDGQRAAQPRPMESDPPATLHGDHVRELAAWQRWRSDGRGISRTRHDNHPQTMQHNVLGRSMDRLSPSFAGEGVPRLGGGSPPYENAAHSTSRSHAMIPTVAAEAAEDYITSEAAGVPAGQAAFAQRGASVRPPLQLSAVTTAFSLGGSVPSAGPEQRQAAIDRSRMEERARWHRWQQQYTAAATPGAEVETEAAASAAAAGPAAIAPVPFSASHHDHRQHHQATPGNERDVLEREVPSDTRGEFIATVAAARAAMANYHLERYSVNGSNSVGHLSPVEAFVAPRDLPLSHQPFRGTYLQALSGSAMRSRPLPPEEATPLMAGVEATEAPPIATSRAAAVRENTGTGVGRAARGSTAQRELSMLPAFRHWESQRSRLRIQWHDNEEQSENILTESLPSDGTLALTERLSVGPSPRGYGRDFTGDGNDEASEVEAAVFSCLMSLDMRRLLLNRRVETGPNAGSHYHRIPEWIEEWLADGAYLNRNACGGPSGDDTRCPQAGDVWEVLQLLLAWWADRLCAVAAGFPLSGDEAVGGVGGRGTSGMYVMGSLAGDTSGAARAVESVQDLRRLGECLLPLSRVREFVGVVGGATPRDAVLLKSVLVVHEGIAWATDRPLYRHYRAEIIPTALALYASLPQDTLEGVDLEVGHTLPESVFVVTSTVRPSWPRWGGNPSGTSRMGHAGNTAASDTLNSRRRLTHGSFSSGDGGATGVENDVGTRHARIGASSTEFMQGPWIVFRVAREEYLEYYQRQAAALDSAIGVSSGNVDDMLC